MNTLAYRIVFDGQIQEGLDIETVRARVGARLASGSLQVDRIFCGKRVVLKSNVSEASARDYMKRLASLGMVVRLELMPGQGTVPTQLAPAAVPVVKQEESWLTNSSFADLARTHINLARAEALLNGTEFVPASLAMEEPPEQLKAPETQPVVQSAALTSTNVVPLPRAQAEDTIVLSGTFHCSHCGMLHQFDASVIIRAVEGRAVRHEMAR